MDGPFGLKTPFGSTTLTQATLSAELSMQLVETDGLRESLAEICASQAEFSRFFSGVSAELETLSADLIRKNQAWDGQRAQTESELQQRADHLEAERAAVARQRDEAWEEVERKRQQVEQEHGRLAAVGEEDDARLAQMLEEADRERAALRAALEAAQSQGDRLVQVTEELSHARTELAEARQEIQRLRDGLENGRAEPAEAPPDDALREKLNALQEERAQQDQERVVLESELDMVRNRAAEMAENLAEQQRQMADERQQWAHELKRMRRLLETLSTRGLGTVTAPAAQAGPVEAQPAADGPHQKPAAAQAEGDPVLGSVMAQFEMLQKDIVRRRRESA